MTKKVLALILILNALLGFSSAGSVGDTATDPVPNITEINFYDVEGLTGDQRMLEGTIVDSGINKTFKLYNKSVEREYRASFKIENKGSEKFMINSSDKMFQKGLNKSWEVGKIWYNVSNSRKLEGNFSEGRIVWNTSKQGVLNPGEVMWAKYLFNVSEDLQADYDQYFNVTDSKKGTGSFDNHVSSVKNLGFLNVSLMTPPNQTYVKKYNKFSLNASISCEKGVCGEVYAGARYKSSSDQELLAQGSGTPFYTEGLNPERCSVDLENFCFAEWDVNATGSLESFHDIDVNASSSLEDVGENSSQKHVVEINKLIVMNLEFDRIDFGVLSPGEKKVSAEGNSGRKYNISFSESSIEADNLYIKSTPLVSVEDKNYEIPAENISASLSNDYSSSTSLSETFKPLASSISPGTTLETFYFLDTPEGIVTGEYRGNITYKANSTY